MSGTFTLVQEMKVARFDIHLLTHIIPVLCRVNARFQRCSPRCRVYSYALVPRAVDRLPIDEERDGIFCLRDTVIGLSSSNAGCCTGNNSRRYCFVLKNPAANIDVM